MLNALQCLSCAYDSRNAKRAGQNSRMRRLAAQTCNKSEHQVTVKLNGNGWSEIVRDQNRRLRHLRQIQVGGLLQMRHQAVRNVANVLDALLHVLIFHFFEQSRHLDDDFLKRLLRRHGLLLYMLDDIAIKGRIIQEAALSLNDDALFLAQRLLGALDDPIQISQCIRLGSFQPRKLALYLLGVNVIGIRLFRFRRRQ